MKVGGSGLFQKWLIENPAQQREWRRLRRGQRAGELDRRPWPWVGLAATAVLYALSAESTPKSLRIITGATPVH